MTTTFTISFDIFDDAYVITYKINNKDQWITTGTQNKASNLVKNFKTVADAQRFLAKNYPNANVVTA